MLALGPQVMSVTLMCQGWVQLIPWVPSYSTILQYHPTVPSYNTILQYHPTVPSYSTILQYHPTVPSYSTILQYHPTVPSYSTILQYHPTVPSYSTILQYHPTVPSYSTILQYHPTVPSYSTILQYHPTVPSYSTILQYHPTVPSYSTILQYHPTVPSYSTILQYHPTVPSYNIILQYHCHIPWQNWSFNANEIAQAECSQPLVIWSIFGWFGPPAACVTYNKYGSYRDSHQSCIRLQIGAGICAVLTADAVATGEVNFYNFIVQLRSLPQFVATISSRTTPDWPGLFLFDLCLVSGVNTGLPLSPSYWPRLGSLVTNECVLQGLWQ